MNRRHTTSPRFDSKVPAVRPKIKPNDDPSSESEYSDEGASSAFQSKDCRTQQVPDSGILKIPEPLSHSLKYVSLRPRNKQPK